MGNFILRARVGGTPFVTNFFKPCHALLISLLPMAGFFFKKFFLSFLAFAAHQLMKRRQDIGRTSRFPL